MERLLPRNTAHLRWQRTGWLLAVWALGAAGCERPPTGGGDRGLRAVFGDGSSARHGEGRPTLAAPAKESEPGARFAKADRVVAFSFPRDHGPHPTFRSEWWYLTAVLTSTEGREFGVQFTVFRRGIAPVLDASARRGAAAWRSGQVYMAHVAVSDVAARRHLHEERFARGHPALASARATPFEVRLEDWRLASVATAAAGDAPTGTAFWPLRLEAAADRFAIDLVLRGGKPIVRQGERGLSGKGPNNASYYYSIPRIDAEGRLRVDGRTHHVVGGAWLDREWSTSVLAPEYAGWDWFALRLDDGRDLMLYRMRRADGQPSGYDSGALINVDGEARILAADEFSLVPQEHWRKWPVAWRLTLRGESSPWTVRAAFRDQVMETSIRYWEGVAHVRNSADEQLGAGYMELTGY